MPKETVEQDVIKLVEKILKADESMPDEAKEPILTLFNYAYLNADIDPQILGKWTILGFVKHGQFGVTIKEIELLVAMMAISWTTMRPVEMVETLEIDMLNTETPDLSG